MSSDPGAAELPFDAATPAVIARPSRLFAVAIGVLALHGGWALVDMVSQISTGRFFVKPAIVEPFVAWGLWRRRRPWWLVARVLVGATLVAMPVLAIAGLFSRRFTLASGAAVQDAPAAAFLWLGVVMLPCLWLHWVLRRPDVAALFPSDTAGARPSWGPWTSVLTGVLVSVVAQVVAGGVAVGWLDLPPAELADPRTLAGNGAFITLILWISAPIMGALVWFAVWLRPGPGIRASLALRPAAAKHLLAGLAVTAAFLTSEAMTDAWLGRSGPEVVLAAYRSAPDPMLFLLATIVAAPIAEELLFRGFLFAGLARSRFGSASAVTSTAVAFAASHAGQYERVDLTYLLVFGVLLGSARARSGSLYVPLTMHVFLNACAMAAAAATLHARG